MDEQTTPTPETPATPEETLGTNTPALPETPDQPAPEQAPEQQPA